jgi:hypothetical protein
MTLSNIDFRKKISTVQFVKNLFPSINTCEKK